MSKREIIISVAIIALIFLMPVILPYYQGLVVLIMIMGVFALGYNLAFGHAGILSMGHGVFFGVAGYTAGILITRWDANVFCLPIGVVAGTAIAFLIGWLMFSRLEVGTEPLTKALFIVIITLGLLFVSYYTFLWPLRMYSGGSNGLTYILRQPLMIVNGFSINLLSDLNAYYLIAVISVLSIAAMRIIVSSPLGEVIHGVRENELRVAFLGHSVFRAKLTIFTLSGFFSAVAGTLYMIRYNIMDLDVFSFLFITEILVICVIGGRRTFYGPLLGAAVFYTAKDILIEHTDLWLLIVAVLLIVIIIFMSEGIAKVIRLK